MKTCFNCKETKEPSCFHKNNKQKDGLNIYCKPCRAFLRKGQYKKETVAAYSRRWGAANPERRKATTDRWLTKHPEERKSVTKRYRESHKEEATEYVMRRLETDPDFKLASNLRNRFRAAVRDDAKTGSAVLDLGCTISEFKLYLEALWEPGMTWNNWGKGPGTWQIDHIRPMSLFDLSDRKQHLYVANFINMQPMWQDDHNAKSVQDRAYVKSLKKLEGLSK